MTARPSPRLAAILFGCAWCAIGLVIAIGVLAQIGWICSIPFLTTLIKPDSVAMTAAVD